jgi:quercetin 2,3-dioxygenase
VPAVTVSDLSTLPVLNEVGGAPRRVAAIVTARQSFEGGGFPVYRPFPQPGADTGITDPFLMLDEMGPVHYGPGQALGAPDHPHRGFETVTYLLDGEMEHRDSTGGGGLLRNGDTQWMTAGAGLVHSEMPTKAMMRDGGLMHGMQLWVNLPRRDKMIPARYQDIGADEITLAASADRKALVRIVAGEVGGIVGPGSTHTPIVYAHVTLEPGARLSVAWPTEFNGLVYCLRGGIRVGGDPRPLGDHQLAVLDGAGEALLVEADEASDVLLLGGAPLREPVAWYGPFVMNTRAELEQAVDDFRSGRMGAIPPAH